MAFTLDHRPSRWMQLVAAYLAICLTSTVVFTTVAPYFGMVPTADPSVAANQALVGNMFIAVVSFFFGASANAAARRALPGQQINAPNASTVSATSNGIVRESASEPPSIPPSNA